MTLYILSNAIRELMASVDESGELTDEVIAKLDALTKGMDAKVDAYGILIREATMRQVARQAEIDRLQAGNQTDSNLAKGLKANLITCMTIAGTRKHKTPLFNVWIQASPPATTCTVDPESLPKALQRIKVEPNNAAALEQWKNTGAAPDGFTVTQGEHIRIK